VRSQPVANIKGTRFLPRSASWDEEMEKRSRRRIRDLVAHPASQGLDANENRCARISMMARSANAPLKGRIQKRKTNNLQIITSGLQRTAGPYRCAKSRREQMQRRAILFDHFVGAGEQRKRYGDAERPCALVTRALASWRPARRQMDRLHSTLDH